MVRSDKLPVQRVRPAARAPVRRNGIATRAKIVEAAITVLGREDGALTARAVAEEAGCSAPAIYQFFTDMDAVAQAAAEVAAAETVAALEAALTPERARRDPAGFFSALVHGIAALQEKRPETLCIAKSPPSGPRAIVAQALRTAVAGLVRSAFLEGRPDLDPDRIERTLSVAQAALLGAVSQVPQRGDPARAAYLDDVAALAGGFVTRALGGDG